MLITAVVSPVFRAVIATPMGISSGLAMTEVGGVLHLTLTLFGVFFRCFWGAIPGTHRATGTSVMVTLLVASRIN